MQASTTAIPNNQSQFHRWLLKHRPYCELCTGPYPSTRIIKVDGHDTACCDAHYRAFGQNEWEQMNLTEKDRYIGIMPK